MIRKQKTALRLAIATHEELTHDSAKQGIFELPTADWQQCQSLLRKMRVARLKGWPLAVERLQRDSSEKLRRLQQAVSDVTRQLEPSSSDSTRASVSEIYADLLALYDEFDEVSFDRHARFISVTTEPIELEGVYLGPFAIRLDLDELAAGPSYDYRVIASDPNPASSDDSVTHPHVQDEVVCEGEGHHPIQRALKQGRLLDFFVIVANLLRTYNSGSPYVSLEHWDGQPCSDCNVSVDADEQWTCEKCESTLCGDCYVRCPDCDGIYCSECVTRCERCDESHCNACLKQCSTCGDEICQSCLETNERCIDCHDQESKEKGEEVVAIGECGGYDDAHTPVQSNRVGEVAVPA